MHILINILSTSTTELNVFTGYLYIKPALDDYHQKLVHCLVKSVDLHTSNSHINVIKLHIVIVVWSNDLKSVL